MTSSKLIVVGTVAAVCIAAVFIQTPLPSQSFLGIDSEAQHAFMQHLVRYGKSYSSKKELTRRFNLFKANFEMVKAHNAKPSVMYKMGLNVLSDMAPEEFQNHSAVDLAEAEDSEEAERYMLQQNVNVTDVDWRNTTYLNPARA